MVKKDGCNVSLIVLGCYVQWRVAVLWRGGSCGCNGEVRVRFGCSGGATKQ